MAIPTIDSRLQKKMIVMTRDEDLLASLQAGLPAGWEMVVTLDLEDLGGFQDILQHRFILLDLDEYDAFDPLDVIRMVRMELMLNVPIFCFGGEPDVRDEARLSRADRFFERDEIVGKMKLFCQQYEW
ncbi:hypothetical protein [Sulfurirhabdus autotrophica]|uniref:Response regulatory domain-containing protein n=1 Tax=Sulfurirhabdus autotrophica TaxID=1706046 RepID=A0A4R3XUD9_9PROT|nr:hypothetical protein [Sulfurirhabdus autotrophica]TCV82562.1 hypothetical protein EDC63_12056 [Sulfurirhabdus autotrophica]